jgi:hypothetical protein
MQYQRMIKPLKFAALALWAAAAMATVATAATTTQTNVLQTINLNLTIHHQGTTNNNKITDVVTNFTSKSLIQALGAVIGTNFGNGAKLVQSTVFSGVTITIGAVVGSTVLSTNLAMPPTNSFLLIGGALVGPITGTWTITSNQLMNNNGEQSTIGGIIVAAAGNTNESVTINTNVGYITTLTPSTDNNGVVTNVAVVLQTETAPAQTESFLTNVSSTIDILSGGAANNLYPIDGYLSVGTNSPEIVVETGSGLDTANGTTPTLASQTSFSIQSMGINYSSPSGPNNMTLSLQGFVKQTLKVDVLAAHGTNKAVVDIFGANASWNVNGSGYIGGNYTTNSTNTVPILGGGYLTNANPIVAEGTITVSFLKNLAQ